MALKAFLDFMPVLSPIAAVLWVARVYSSSLEKLRRAYVSAAVPVPSSFTTSGWSPFRITPTDPPSLKADKERIVAGIRRRNRLLVPLFFVTFFGLAILSILIQSALDL